MSLVPSDSTQAMASLVSAYADEDADDADEAPVTNTDTVADTEPVPEETSPPSHEHRHSFAISDDDDHPSSAAGSDRASPAEPPQHPVNKHLAVEPVEKTDTDTSSPFPTVHSSLEKRPTLVSYGPDAEDDADSDESAASDDESVPGLFSLVNSKRALSRNMSTASMPVRSDGEVTNTDVSSPYNITEDDIQLPPEPPGSCSKRLQEKVAKAYERLREGKDLNLEIQRRKDFRNPSIYEKLVQFCGIDEKGTNYPPELYNPLIWGKDSYYDELARIQTEWIHEKEKEAKKSKVEFQKGVKKPAPSDSAAAASAPDVKRKSKWDERTATSSATVTAKQK